MQAYANEQTIDNYKRCTGLTVFVNSLRYHVMLQMKGLL
jgi:hypothetical protein